VRGDERLDSLLDRFNRDSRGVTAFVDVNVVPMDSNRVLPHQTVVIRSGRIFAMGRAGEIDAPEGAERIDGRDKYLVPGLADMHFHLFPSDGGVDPASVDDVLALLVANGVTSVRSTIGNASHLELRDRIRTGKTLGPTLYLASPPLKSKEVPTPARVRELVYQYKTDGFDLIKLVLKDRTDYDSAVAAAREVGLPIFGHVGAAIGIEHALEAGQSVEHLDGYVRVVEEDPKRLPGLVRATRRANVWNCPTQSFHEGLYERDLAKVSSFAGVSLVRQSVRDEWGRKKTEDNAKYADKEAANARELATRRRIIKALRDGGVRLLVGSDSPDMFRVPGFAMIEEMRALHGAGMTPYEVLASATRLPAEYFGALGEFGTVQVGKRADLILLNANPLRNLEAVSDQAGVMLRGAWFPRSVLDDAARRHAAALF
jgi:imidazolonepropionase-like amidohydrolase